MNAAGDYSSAYCILHTDSDFKGHGMVSKKAASMSISVVICMFAKPGKGSNALMFSDTRRAPYSSSQSSIPNVDASLHFNSVHLLKLIRPSQSAVATKSSAQQSPTWQTASKAAL
jgi:hypothetical protein